MKILLIGDFSENYDEGLKNIAKYFYLHLSRKHDIKRINVKNFLSKETLSIITGFDPEIIHCFSAPTYSSLVLIKCLSIRWPSSKTIISALRPQSSFLSKSSIIRKVLGFFVIADIILYQDNSDSLVDLGSELIYLPNGVNTNRFIPTIEEDKTQLRKKYKIDEKKFVLTHVGHLFKRRNLEIFIELQQKNPCYQVVIVAGTYLAKDTDLLQRLRQGGCLVFTGYLEQVEDIYRLSDCYVFPVLWGNSISIPLSVLEAMACNLPIVSINYPTLLVFSDTLGFYLVETPNDIIHAVDKVYREISNRDKINTRLAVLPYSWENVGTKLEEIYLSMLGGSYD